MSAGDDGWSHRQALNCGGACSVLRTATRAVLISSLKCIGFFFDVRTYDLHKFQKHVMEKKSDEAVITVANHDSIVDDPLIFSLMLPTNWFFKTHEMRWGWCTAEVCFPRRNMITDFIFETGKIFPIVRGNGLEQKGIRHAVGHLTRGDWFHVFPEGRVAYPQLWQVNKMGPFRWGVGKLVVETHRRTGKAPKVVPFVHRGMHVNLPRHEEKYVLPLPRTPIRILVGDPIDFQSTLDAHQRLRRASSGRDDPFFPPDEDIYEAVTEQIKLSMDRLQNQMDDIIISEEGPDSPSLSNTSLYYKK